MVTLLVNSADMLVDGPSILLERAILYVVVSLVLDDMYPDEELVPEDTGDGVASESVL